MMENSHSSFSPSMKTFTMTVVENTDDNVDASTDQGYHLSQRIQNMDINGFYDQTMVSEGIYDEFLHLLSEEDNPEEQLKALHICLEKLPEEQRTSITRFFLEEMSYADIAEQTGLTLNNVKSYIQNGKRNLKICIKKQTL